MFEFALGTIKLSDKTLEAFKASKPHIVGEMREWLGVLQHSIRTPNLECRYYLEIEIKHNGFLGKDMPIITVPLNVYYHNNIFLDGPPAEE